MAVFGWTGKELFWNVAITALCIVCFPANPLVLTGVLKTGYYPATFIIGWIIWAFGMVLVMAPIVMFPLRGGVPAGKSFVNTTRLVKSGIYAVVRHPQYLGGILSIFITTLLWYPHWLFAVLGITGTVFVYLSTGEEDKRLIEKFGDDYVAYMQQVPGMNIISGILRKLRRPSSVDE